MHPDLLLDCIRSTLISIEKGYEGVSIGYYLSILHVLGLEKDFLFIAKDDEYKFINDNVAFGT